MGFAPRIVADAEVVEDELAAAIERVGGVQSDLVCDERDRARGAHGSAANEAALRIEPGGNVDREHRSAAAIDARDRLRERSFEVALHAEAEEAIDDERGPRGVRPLARERAAVRHEALARRARFRRLGRLGGEIEHDDPMEGFREACCRDPRIAAVIAGPGDDEDLLAGIAREKMVHANPAIVRRQRASAIQ